MSLCSARRNPFDPVPRQNTLRSSRAKGLASLLLLAATFAARAQGGPPFRTDDPETPGNLHWEINFGFIADRNPAAGAYQVPDFDINYGFGDRIQLKYEMPIAIEETRPQPGDPSSPGQTVGGLGDSQPGIKWRFYERHPNDPYFKNRFGTGLLGLFAHTSPQAHPSPAAPQPEVNFSISTYPQLTLGNPTRSVSRGIVGAGPNFLLPLEFNARFGPIRINGDVGYNFGNRSTPQSWARGFLFGHEFSDRTEAYLELYDQQDSTIVRPARGVGQFASPASKQAPNHPRPWRSPIPQQLQNPQPSAHGRSQLPNDHPHQQPAHLDCLCRPSGPLRPQSPRNAASRTKAPQRVTSPTLTLHFLPTTMTSKLSGNTLGRGRGISAVAAGAGPNFAVTRYTLSFAAS